MEAERAKRNATVSSIGSDGSFMQVDSSTSQPNQSMSSPVLNNPLWSGTTFQGTTITGPDWSSMPIAQGQQQFKDYPAGLHQSGATNSGVYNWQGSASAYTNAGLPQQGQSQGFPPNVPTFNAGPPGVNVFATTMPTGSVGNNFNGPPSASAGASRSVVRLVKLLSVISFRQEHSVYGCSGQSEPDTTCAREWEDTG